MGRNRGIAALVALLTLAGACSSEAADEGSGDDGTDGGGGTPLSGITDDTINVSFIGADFTTLAEQGLAPDLGNMPVTVEAMVDDINENGGIGGRQVNLTLDLVDGLAGADLGRAACIKATQQDDAAVVLLSPAISRAIARCTAVQERTITIGLTGWDDPLYEEAEGRLFSVGSQTSMGNFRNSRAWADVLDEEGVLDGHTIGVVTSADVPSQSMAIAAEDGLVPHLEELGHEVGAFALLPCPEGDSDCEQHEPTMQSFKDAGVDLVFLQAGAVAGPAVIAAARDLDYDPEWVVCCNTVTDTVAQFYAGVAEELDGTLGVSTLFDTRSEEAEECNQIVRDRTDEDYASETDAFGFTAVNCIALLVLRDGVDAIDGPITEAALIAAIEGLGDNVPSLEGQPSSLAPDKHDAGDAVFLARYSAESGTFEDVSGQTPIEVPA